MNDHGSICTTFTTDDTALPARPRMNPYSEEWLRSRCYTELLEGLRFVINTKSDDREKNLRAIHDELVRREKETPKHT